MDVQKAKKDDSKATWRKKNNKYHFFFVSFALVEFKERFSCRPWRPGVSKKRVGGMVTHRVARW